MGELTGITIKHSNLYTKNDNGFFSPNALCGIYKKSNKSSINCLKRNLK